MKLPSLALAQAFQFDLKLYDGQIIGEWVPLTEPGESAIQSRTIVWRWGTKRSRPAKWLRGLQWSQIDENHTLRHEVNGKTVKIDLRRHPGIMAELKKLTPLPKSDPLIVYEKTGSPYTDAQYRWLWRRVATKAGIASDVRNVTGISQSTPLQLRSAISNEIIADLAMGEIELDARQWLIERHLSMAIAEGGIVSVHVLRNFLLHVTAAQPNVSGEKKSQAKA
jgi:hypothetical protein